jgi:hypothetical protein
LLEALVCLSLFFCLNSPGDTSIEGVPAKTGSAEDEWQIRRHGEDQVSLAPYPFRRNPLSVGILARRVAKRFYRDDTDFRIALAQAPYFALNFTLRRGDAANETRIAVA